VSHDYMEKFEPGVYAEVILDADHKSAIAKATGLDVKRVTSVADATFDATFRALMGEVRKWLEYVAFDTGRLRRSLRAEQEKSKVWERGTRMTIHMGTKVPYASYVNLMPEQSGSVKWTWKRGPNKGKSFYPHVRHGKDPLAIQDFWGRMRMNTRTRLVIILWDQLYKFAPAKTYGVFKKNIEVIT
jgi:hypothetical protein